MADVPPTQLVQPTAARSSPAGCRRWTLFAAGLVLVILIGLLLASYKVVERGMDLVVHRASRRLIRDLPANLDLGERARLVRNLDRFSAAVERAEDPNALGAPFVDLVIKVFEDDRLTGDEVEEVNRYLESTLPAVEVAPTPSEPG